MSGKSFLAGWFWEGAEPEATPQKPGIRMMKRLGKPTIICVSAVGVLLGFKLTALFCLKQMTAICIFVSYIKSIEDGGKTAVTHTELW